MRILLVANYLQDRQESMERFAKLLQSGLLRDKHEVRLTRPSVVAGNLLGSNRGVGKWMGYVDKFGVFPGSLRSAARWPDVVHICDHSNAMYSAWVGSTPTVITCHDMLAVRGALGEATDCPASPAGKYLQKWIVRGLRHADCVASVSSATALDVERIVHRSDASKRVILNALNYPYYPVPHEESTALLAGVTGLDLSKPFVLHVGSNLARKNRAVVVRAFARAVRHADLQLVLAGQPPGRELNELIRELKVQDRVIVATKPTNEVLRALYSTALCFLFPSRFEGFGWPLIEAQACGCPVTCSRCAPFSEVVGESAIMRNAEDDAGFAEDLLMFVKDSSARALWAERGLKNAQRFAPDQMISAYTQIYEELVNR